MRRQFRQYSENVHVKAVASPGIFERFQLRFALYKRKYVSIIIVERFLIMFEYF